MKALHVVTAAMVLVLTGSTVAYPQQTAEELYQAALYEEEVKGDLESAIALFQRILDDHSSNRLVAAKAQLHIGICYETLGLQEAQQAYQRVVTNYGDQSDVVSQARVRLAALNRHTEAAAPAGRMTRLLLTDEETDINHFFDMQVSPDGRRIVHTDLGYTGDVYIRDMASGDTTKVADGWAVSPVWSADGKRIAFSTVISRDPIRNKLSILDLESGEKTTPAAVAEMNLEPIDWSPTPDMLACALAGNPSRPVLALVSLSTGDTTTLAPFHRYMSADFSPDGRYVAYSNVVDGNTDVYVLDLEAGERHRITSSPEMEGYPRWSPSGDVLMYTTPNSGMWAVSMDGGTATAAPRLLTSERYDQPAGWVESGQYFYVKYNTMRQLLRVPVDPVSLTAAGPPEHMPIAPEGIGGFYWSPDTRHMVACKDSELTIYTLEGREVRTFDGSDCRIVAPTWSSDGSELFFTSVSDVAAWRGERKPSPISWSPTPGLFPRERDSSLAGSWSGRS